jgi:hypothetical protein
VIQLLPSVTDRRIRYMRYRRPAHGRDWQGCLRVAWHRLMHWLSFNEGTVIAVLGRNGDILIGFRCAKCGRVSHWFISNDTIRKGYGYLPEDQDVTATQTQPTRLFNPMWQPQVEAQKRADELERLAKLNNPPKETD